MAVIYCEKLDSHVDLDYEVDWCLEHVCIDCKGCDNYNKEEHDNATRKN